MHDSRPMKAFTAKEQAEQMNPFIDFLDETLAEFPSEFAYTLISDRLASTAVEDKCNAFLVCLLRLTYPYYEHIYSYSQTFERVWNELVKRGRSPEEMLCGLPIDKYKPKPT